MLLDMEHWALYRFEKRLEFLLSTHGPRAAEELNSRNPSQKQVG